MPLNDPSELDSFVFSATTNSLGWGFLGGTSGRLSVRGRRPGVGMAAAGPEKALAFCVGGEKTVMGCLQTPEGHGTRPTVLTDSLTFVGWPHKTPRQRRRGGGGLGANRKAVASGKAVVNGKATLGEVGRPSQQPTQQEG